MAEGDRWTPPDLEGQVALVTGASRGVGRGIAEVLADCGARTYLVARSTGDLEAVAEAIRSRGGHAAVAACDLGVDADVDALLRRIATEEGHLEILANNAVGWEHEPADDEAGAGDDPGDPGPPEFVYQPPWHAPRWWWDDNFGVGVRSHWLVTNAAAPLFVAGRRGVVLFTSERQPDEPGAQELVLDLRATVVRRMAFLFSLHLRPHRTSSILLYPGFTRTEAIRRAFESRSGEFEGWTERDFLARTASPHFAGRAAASLAADPALLDRTGTLVTSYDAALAYGFTDITGEVPDPV